MGIQRKQTSLKMANRLDNIRIRKFLLKVNFNKMIR